MIAVVNISTASILVRLANVHGFVAAAWRLILSSIVTLALLFASKEKEDLRKLRIQDLSLMIISGIALALHFGLWMMSLFHLTIAASVTIVDSYPALLALIGYYLLKENYSKSQIIGSFIAMGGVAGLAITSSHSKAIEVNGNPLLGSLLSFAGMIAVAIYFSIGKTMRARYGTLTYTGIVYTIASITSVIIVKELGYNLTGYPLKTYMYFVGLALLPMLGGHSIINFALKKLSLLAATVPVLGEPVGAAFLALIILGENPGLLAVFWMIVTLVGIGMVLIKEKS